MKSPYPQKNGLLKKKKNPLVENLSLYKGRTYCSTFKNWYEFMNQMMADGRKSHGSPESSILHCRLLVYLLVGIILTY